MFRCKIVDIDDKNMYIDYPISTSSEQVFDFEVGKQINICYVKNNTVFEFTGNIIKRTKVTVPVLVLALPEESAIKRIQRREFVRVDAGVDIAIHCPDNTFAPFTSITKDISGGGASIIIPNEIEFEEDAKIELYYVLKSLQSDYHYLKSEAQVVQTRIEHNLKTISVQFLSNDDRTEQQIVHYTFDKQREERMRELV